MDLCRANDGSAEVLDAIHEAICVYISRPFSNASAPDYISDQTPLLRGPVLPGDGWAAGAGRHQQGHLQ